MNNDGFEVDLGILGTALVKQTELGYWQKVGAYIVGDGYTENGVRVHVIDSPSDIPRIVSNCVVITQDVIEGFV